MVQGGLVLTRHHSGNITACIPAEEDHHVDGMIAMKGKIELKIKQETLDYDQFGNSNATVT